MSIYVAQCRQCNSQHIIPYQSRVQPLGFEDIKMYCSQCGKVYTLDELLAMYVAL